MNPSLTSPVQLNLIGEVPLDPAVREAVQRRQLLLESLPGSEAARRWPRRPAACSTGPDRMTSADESRDATASPFDILGGEAVVRTLVDRFYDLMDLEPTCAGIRALHPPSLSGSRDKLLLVSVRLAGRPRSLHPALWPPAAAGAQPPFAIGIAERDQWMACMMQAMAEVGLATDLADRLTRNFFGTADWMRNQGG